MWIEQRTTPGGSPARLRRARSISLTGIVGPLVFFWSKKELFL
jgi:hypothetical protein